MLKWPEDKHLSIILAIIVLALMWIKKIDLLEKALLWRIKKTKQFALQLSEDSGVKIMIYYLLFLSSILVSFYAFLYLR